MTEPEVQEYVAAMRQRIERLEAELNECLEFIKSHMGVVIAPDGQAKPNRAMQLVNKIDESLHGRGK